MNKNLNIHVLISILVFLLSGCILTRQVGNPAEALLVEPTATLTLAPSLTPLVNVSTSFSHYVPSKEFDIRLEFDYPSSWLLTEEKREAGIIIVGLGDPRYRTLPTASPEECHHTPTDYGNINIWIEPLGSGETLEMLVEPYRQGVNNKSWIKPLSDYRTKVDSYDAIVLEQELRPFDGNGYSSDMFERNIFFVIQDQIYQIDFLVAVKDRGSEFEVGYEYFMKSLKVIP